jgi:glycosyltransferase involved in cell wall biosynthesis
VSLLTPDTPEYQNIALRNNGRTYMREILLGFIRAGLSSVTAISARPVPSFPRSRTVWVRRRHCDIDGVALEMVPFLNVTPVKQPFIGVAVALSLFAWRWRTRHVKRHAVVAFNLSVPSIAWVTLAARCAGARLGAYVCDVNVPGDTVPDNLLYRADAWLHRRFIRKVDSLVVITDRIAQDFAPGMPFLRVDGGLPSELLSEPSIPPRADDAFVIVATGSLQHFNGFPELLAAFSTLIGPNYRLHIAGYGPLESMVRKAVAEDPRIRYHGFLPYRELLRLHMRADVLVSLRITRTLDTQYAFPSKTMEYLASGVPVITTNIGHMKEEYGSLCVVVADESAEALADAIRAVAAMSPRERSDLGTNARAYMLTKKTWVIQSRRLVNHMLGLR